MRILIDMVSGQALGIGIIVLVTVTAYLYFSKKAKLQGMTLEQVAEKGEADGRKMAALAKKEDQAKWSEIFDDIQEYQNDFPDAR